MHDLALSLNNIIKNKNKSIFAMLSTVGQNIFFPKGILFQSAQAKEKATRFNATIGIAMEESKPMFLQEYNQYFTNLEPEEIYPYASPAGRPKLRTLWQKKILQENPSLQNKQISLPVVTHALTHGLALISDLFSDVDDTLILPDQFWGNYRLLFVTKKQNNLVTFPFFTQENTFNVAAFAKTLEQEAQTKDKLTVILNFPNNPTGYTPKLAEVQAICDVLQKQAEKGTKLIIVCDDAYTGLFFEDSIQESIFASLCDLHENLLAIKVDGATKEDYVWGFRVGFLTFGCKQSSPELYAALEEKTTGLIRISTSSSVQSSQSILEKTLQSPKLKEQKKEKFQLLKDRALTAKALLDSPKFKNTLSYYPFNSGYFFCLKLYDTKIEAETLRVHLLDKYGVGTISTAQYDLRLAFSCIDKKNIETLLSLVAQGIEDLTK